MKEGEFAKRWRKFSKFAVPWDADQTQREAMKEAFYAGAFSLVSIITKCKTEEEAGRMMVLCGDEIQEYSRHVMERERAKK